ncbi:SufS family cysteine desulfurase [Oceanotoga sp. DSM 15011]|uniref:SufS family cysteine desulfurase n=1 Tax=Oceanotoga sp. DSM 15011 TaxID=2984951 RepID=UPI0021F40965|nr:SufS family cysteine desulfurase [Oceanotoga sp. DSM 15011]UYO99710.1 SufS family cysteine desulfurase [Oceanotoga sp. DSM 15011]
MLLSQKFDLEFPSLNRNINENKLVYLDSAATTLLPKRVANRVYEYSLNHRSNVHRSSHTLAAESTLLLEETRDLLKDFLNASSPKEIIFTKGTTESINLVAYSLAISNFFNDGDEILLNSLEHHANFVPWQQIGKNFNINTKVFKNKDGIFNESEYLNNINKNTRLVAITAHSNVTGQIIDIKDLIKKIKNINEKTLILIDAAQYVPHHEINLKELNADFVAFSGHKMLAPGGIGILWGKKKILNDMNPFLFGGEMIDQVDYEDTSFNILPYKFEAGTPNMEGVSGLNEAIKIINEIGFDLISNHISDITQYAINKLNKLDFIELYGPKDSSQFGIISFNLKNIHPHDVSHLLNDLTGIAIRSGHHCAQLIMKDIGIQSSCRASFYIYNDKNDVDKLYNGLMKVWEWLK